MRTRSSTERSRISAARPNHHLKVEVENADRTYKDLTNLSGADWVDSAEWGESIDQPMGNATIRLRRDTTTPSTLSLAPAIGGSPLNRDNAGFYAPLLDSGRNVRISTAVTAAGVAPVSGDWKLMFIGRIDSVKWNADPVEVQCRDLGGWILDAFIQEKRVYATDAPTPVEDVMSAILGDWPVFGAPTLLTPVSPGWMINNTKQTPQERKAVLEALQQDWALSIGWLCRYRFDASDNYRLTFYEPPRTKSTPDDTFGPGEYRDITGLEIADADVRNLIVGKCFGPDGTPIKRTAQNVTSQGKYGVRFMEIQLAASDAIDTEDEMDRLLAAAASDLGAPFATHEMETLYYWPAQLHDLYQFASNGTHYDSAQNLAVVSYTHKFANGEGWTTIQCGGTVKGAFRAWFRDGAPNADTPPLAMRVVQTHANSLQVTVAVYIADPAPEPSSPILITAEGVGVVAVLPETDALAYPDDLVTRDLTTTAFREFVITRPDTDQPAGRVVFTAERDNRLPAVQSIDVLARGQYTIPEPTIGPVTTEATARDGNAEACMHVPIVFEFNTAEVRIYATESPADETPPSPDLVENRLAHTVIRHEGVIASAEDWPTEVDISTTSGYNRRIIAIPIGPTGIRGEPFTVTALCEDVGDAPTAPPTDVTVDVSVTGGTSVATVTWDNNGDVDSQTRVWRNGIVLARTAPGVATLVDDGVSPGRDYDYRVQHIRNGQTSEFAGAAGIVSGTPTLVAPTWATGYPRNGGNDSTVDDPPPNGQVLIRAVNPDPLARTEVWMNDQSFDGGTYLLVATIDAGLSDVLLNSGTMPHASLSVLRFFYLVSVRTGYTSSTESSHESANFGF